MPSSLKQILIETKESLRNQSPSPEADAESLITYIKNISKLDLLTKQDEISFNDEEINKLKILIERRINNEPIAYVINKKEFFSRNFYVDKRVLIPRPETEIIIEEVLKRNKKQNISCLDLGTGSGCLIISLFLELQSIGINVKAEAVDISDGALKVASQNAINLKADINFYKSFWFKNVQRKFDYIVANPPYIPENDERVSVETHEHEPHLALYSGVSGEEALSEIISQVPSFLFEDGMFLMEFGAGQGEAVRRLSEKYFKSCEILQDLQGIERVFVGMV